MSVRFSVLIPTYNRPDYLPGLLDAWEAVERPMGGHEIVLADDGSQASLEAIVRPYLGRMTLRFLPLQHGGVAATRQSALEAALGEFVLITDDDCRPCPGLLRAYEEALPRFPGHALGGPVVNLLEDNILSETTQAITTYVTDAWNASAEGARFFTGSNVLLPKEQLVRMGGFDRSWRCRTGEDRDLCRRWAEAGYRMSVVPSAEMGHAHRLDFRAFLRQHYHYGQGRWWSEHRRRAVHAGPPAWSGPGFYLGLFLHPYRHYRPSRAVGISFLTACAQVATAVGSLQAMRAGGHGGV
ncbi:MAG: glycosyltransferase [Limisphaerales bacterium]